MPILLLCCNVGIFINLCRICTGSVGLAQVSFLRSVKQFSQVKRVLVQENVELENAGKVPRVQVVGQG